MSAPIAAVPPSRATALPNDAAAGSAISCCCAHEEPEPTNAYAAPEWPTVAPLAPTRAVPPSSATAAPNQASGAASAGVSVAEDGQSVPERVKT